MNPEEYFSRCLILVASGLSSAIEALVLRCKFFLGLLEVISKDLLNILLSLTGDSS